MRSERSLSGGACSSGSGGHSPCHSKPVSGVIAASATTGSAGAGPIGSAFTKFCSTCVRQSCGACFVRWQQPCAGCFEVNESSTCGQEKQFPQNRAATTNAAITELETARI